MNHNDIYKESERLENLRRFNIEKSIEGAEAFKYSEDLSILKSLLSECLDKSENKLDFLKSFSSDLKTRFPQGEWRTINGAHVFLNNGKVVAGLGGFNKEIDKFFEEKKASKESEKKEEKKENPEQKDLEREKIRLTTQALKTMPNSPKQLKIREKIDEINKKLKDSEKQSSTETENKQEREMNQQEKAIYDSYKKNKTKFFKDQYESALRNGYDESKKKLEFLIENAPTEEYKNMLLEVKEYTKNKEEEPAKLKSEFKKKDEEIIDKFSNEYGVRLIPENILSGDVVQNFYDYDEYLKLAKKAGEKSVVEYNPSDFEGKNITVKKKEIKVKETTKEKALEDLVSKDKFHKTVKPAVTGIYYDPEGYMVATDLYHVTAIKTDIGDKSGKVIDPKTGEEIKLNDSDYKFPKWQNVIPLSTSEEKKAKLSDLHSLASQAKFLRGFLPSTIVGIDGVKQVIAPELFHKVISSLRKLGLEDVTIKHSPEKENTGVLIVGKTSKGEEVKSLIMPMDNTKKGGTIVKQN